MQGGKLAEFEVLAMVAKLGPRDVLMLARRETLIVSSNPHEVIQAICKIVEASLRLFQ